MRKTIVVGGGIVGITAAYFAKKRGDEVVLIESDQRLGGLLKSDCNEYGSFDFGTHIASKTGVKELDEFLFSDFTDENSYIFNLGRSGNYFNGELNDASPYTSVKSLPDDVLNKGSMELLSSNNDLGENLEETLINRYGVTFYEYVFKENIENTFGCSASELASECLNFFDMDRLLIFDVLTTEKLKTIDDFDKKIAYWGASKGCEKFYPKVGGIGKWIINLEEKLDDIGVHVRLSTVIKGINNVGSSFSVQTENDVFEADELVWTLSSALLNRFIKTPVQTKKPVFRKTGLYDFVFQEPLKTKSYYINVRDNDILANRITFYQNLEVAPTFFACTVEVLQNEGFDFDSGIDESLSHLYRMGLVDENNKCIFKQHREVKEGFPALTTEMVSSLKVLNDYYQENNPGIVLLGRSSAKGFFMSELLVGAYQGIYENRR